MADANAKEQSQYAGKDAYKNLIRKDGQTWEAEKYARMGVYAYLMNRMLGKPERWGLDNEDVSFQFKDKLKNSFDEIVAEYVPDGKIGSINLKDPTQKQRFFKEMDEYSEHCQVINPNKTVPSLAEMENFLQAVCDDKNSFYMSIHKSVVEKSGEFGDDEKRKMESLIAERNLKNRQIDDAKYALRRDNFWTGLKGAGALGSGGLTVGGAVGAFLIPFPLGLVLGIAGVAGGFVGLRNFGPSFLNAVKENIKKRQQLRDLKKRGGPKGKRGLKEIEDQINYNRGLLRIMDSVHKIKEDGSMPTLDEFIAYIKKHEPFVYQRITSGKYEGNFKKLWRQSKGHYEANSGGDLKKVMGYISEHGVTAVTKNDELGIERQDYYNEIFDEKLNSKYCTIEVDEETGKPKKVGGKLVHTDDKMSIEDWIRYNDKLVNDEGAFEKMKREYLDLKKKAARSSYTVFMDTIFNQPYKASAAYDYANLIGENGNKNLKDALQNHPEGNKLQMIQNAVNFLNIETKSNNKPPLDGSLGVSITAQIVANENFNKNVTLGCEQILSKVKKSNPTVYAADLSAAKSIVSRIHTVLNSEDVPATTKSLEVIKNEIESSSISTPEVKEYLKKMIDRKKLEANQSNEDIENSIKSKVDTDALSRLLSDATFSSTYNRIKQAISKYSRIEDYRTINEQINSLYYAGSDTDLGNELEKVKSVLRYSLNKSKEANDNKMAMDARAGVLDDISHGRLNASEKLDEYFKKIEEVNYTKIKDNYTEILDFYNNSVLKASSESVKKYLQMRLANKFVLSFETVLRDTSLYSDKDNGSVQLRKDLQRILSCPFLTPSQKAHLKGKYQMHIEIALKPEINKMHEELLNKENNFSRTINTYLSNDLKAGGFRDYFNETVEMKAYQQRYEAYRTILSKENTLFQYSYDGLVSNTDSDSKNKETGLVISLLTSDNGDLYSWTTDPETGDTIDRLNTQDTISRVNRTIDFATSMKTRISSTPARPIIYKDPEKGEKIFSKNEEIVKTFNDIINQTIVLGSDKGPDGLYNVERYGTTKDGNPLEVQEMLARMILMRRQLAMIIRGQIQNAATNSGKPVTDLNTFFETPEGSAIIDQIKEGWKDTCLKIDSAIDNLQKELGEFNYRGSTIELADQMLNGLTKYSGAYSRSKEPRSVGIEMGA